MVQEKRARSYIPMDDRPRKCCVEICNVSALASSLAMDCLDFQASQPVHETLNSNLHPIVMEGGSAI